MNREHIALTLLDNNANPNIQDHYKRRALYYAMKSRNLEIAVLLWEKNFRHIQDIDTIGWSPASHLKSYHATGCALILRALINNESWKDCAEFIQILEYHRCATYACLILNHLRTILFLIAKSRGKPTGCVDGYLLHQDLCRHGFEADVVTLSRHVLCRSPQTTIFTLVTGNRKKWCAFAKNEVLLQIATNIDHDFKNLTPRLGFAVNEVFEKGKLRRRILEAAQESSTLLFGERLPEHLINEIFAYIDDNDINNLNNFFVEID